MEIRKMNTGDLKELKQLCSILFHDPYTEERITKDIEYENKENSDYLRLGAYENGKLLGSIGVFPYKVLFENNVVNMTGIGDVVSSIDARGKGVIKELYKKAFEIMKDSDQPISHLYPFRGDYYRKYGYEVTAEQTTWEIPVDMIKVSNIGSIKHYEDTEQAKEAVKSIYYEFIKNKNLAVYDKKWHLYFDRIKPFDKDIYPYIHYTNGVADGFFTYNMKKYDDKIQDIIVYDFWYRDLNGIRGMLDYFASLKDYSDYVKIPCNDDLGAFAEFNGGWGRRNTLRSTDFCGSTRIVDVEKILNLKNSDANVTIEVTDEYCPWNNDIFTISNGKVTRGKKESDAKMSIRAFSSLILGRYDNLELVNELEIINKKNELSKLFPKRKIWIDEHF